MKNQKELKADFAGIPGVSDYEVKNTAYVVELPGGDLIGIEKPRIKTRFCFGYGYYGVSTLDDDKAANEAARRAETDKQYFLDENMKSINKTIEDLKKGLNGSVKYYIFNEYCNTPADSKLKGFSPRTMCFDPDYEPDLWNKYPGMRKATSEDIKAILAGYEEVKKSFEKRLNTYLKKYGLSKIDSWTYLRD